MSVVSPLAGRLSDRIEPRLLASAGMALSAAGLFLFIPLNPSTPIAAVIADLVLLGLGFGLFSSPNTHAVMGSVERRHYGVASSSLGTMRLTGQMFSLGISVLVMSLFMGNSRISQATASLFLKSTRMSFLVFGLLCLAGIFASLARGNRRLTPGSSGM
jgi:MFS family permease